MIALPAMSRDQSLAWHAVLDVAEQLPTLWTLVGGQMVHLHCLERGVSPQRPTDDADAVIDIRAEPRALEIFTAVLADLGFGPLTSGDGLQHRWLKRAGDGVAQIDVLLPDGIGERAAGSHGVGGAPTLPAAGGSQALRRTEVVAVLLDGRQGQVPRPTLVGALVAKAAAHGADTMRRERHLADFLTLAQLLAARDVRGVELSTSDRRHLRTMAAAVRKSHRTDQAFAQPILARLERATRT